MFIRNLSLRIQLFHHSVTEESQTMYIFFFLNWLFQVQTEIMCTGTSLFNVIICFKRLVLFQKSLKISREMEHSTSKN